MWVHGSRQKILWPRNSAIRKHVRSQCVCSEQTRCTQQWHQSTANKWQPAELFSCRIVLAAKFPALVTQQRTTYDAHTRAIHTVYSHLWENNQMLLKQLHHRAHGNYNDSLARPAGGGGGGRLADTDTSAARACLPVDRPWHAAARRAIVDVILYTPARDVTRAPHAESSERTCHAHVTFDARNK